MNGSKSNTELVYEILGAYERGDDETLRKLMQPDSEIHAAPGLINAGTYHGFEGFQDWLKQWDEAWDETRYELGEAIELDDEVVVLPVHIVGVGAGSGVEIDADLGWLYQWRNGVCVRFHVYEDFDTAVAVGRRIAAERV